MWTLRLVARLSSEGCLVSDFCSSGRGFAPHFLQTPPRDDALVLRWSFTSIRLDRRLALPSDRACWAHYSTASKAVASDYGSKPDRSACGGRPHVTLKSSSGSGGLWFFMYSAHTSSVTLPLLATQ